MKLLIWSKFPSSVVLHELNDVAQQLSFWFAANSSLFFTVPVQFPKPSQMWHIFLAVLLKFPVSSTVPHHFYYELIFVNFSVSRWICWGVRRTGPTGTCSRVRCSSQPSWTTTRTGSRPEPTPSSSLSACWTPATSRASWRHVSTYILCACLSICVLPGEKEFIVDLYFAQPF